MDREALYEHYQEKVGWLERIAKAQLSQALVELCAEFHRKFPHIARPKPPECRVKRFDRICEKAGYQEIGWPHKKVFLIKGSKDVEVIVNDLVAGRIVCAVPADVERLADLVNAWPNRFGRPQIENKHDRQTGYRACHIDATIPLCLAADQIRFPVEIQIKTLLQDAWANFGHDEFYKTAEDVPTISQQISLYLSDTLASLDLIGQAIREERLRKLVAAPPIPPEETLVTVRTLNYLSDRAFKESMNTVELQRCVAQLRAFGYDNLARVDDLARDPLVKNAVAIAKAKTGLPGQASPFEILFFGPVAAKGGQAAAEAEICRMYGLTGDTCPVCGGAIQEADKEFIEGGTDLDGLFMCERCAKAELRGCERCGLLSESSICKNCRSKEPDSQIV